MAILLNSLKLGRENLQQPLFKKKKKKLKPDCQFGFRNWQIEFRLSLLHSLSYKYP